VGAAIALAACGGSGEGDPATSAGPTGGGGAVGSGGASVSTSGSGGANSGGSTHGSAGGGAPNEAGSSGGAAIDASVETNTDDARIDVASPPQCLGAHEACGDDGGTCCEAYVCRLGQCCVPTGIRSNCISNSDCCSNSCVLNQCTCVPLGYSCTGPGQCCSGFSCENGTCICPPDIRGCPPR
jgi:hypothetical protein